MRIGDYTLVYRSLDERAAPNATEIRATLGVRRGDRDLGNAPGGQERLHDRAAGLERGRDPERPADGRGSLRHRRADRPGRERLLPRLREAARQPHLARRARLPARLADHAVARPSRAAKARRARVRGRPARNTLTLALVLAAALAVACVVAVAMPFLREPEPESDALDELDDDERRRLELLEARDRALVGAQGARVRPSHGDGLRRGLPSSGRPAAPRGGVGASGARPRFGGGSTSRRAKLEGWDGDPLALARAGSRTGRRRPRRGRTTLPSEKAAVDARIAALQADIAESKAQEGF